MQTIVERLNFSNKLLLYKLQELAPIAGSAASVPETAADIDFFILNNDELTLYSMIQIIAPFATHYRLCDPTYPDAATIVTFCIGNETMPIQFVLTSHKDVHELISKFDMDYIQCAFYKDQFVETKEAQRAQKQQKIFVVNDYHHICRFQKAIAKQFESMLFFDVLNKKPQTPFLPINDFDVSALKLVPLQERKQTQINCSKIELTGFETRNVYGDNYKIYYHFVLTDKDSKRTNKVRYIGLRATILNIQDFVAYNILTLDVLQLDCLRIRCANNFSVDVGGTYVFVFELSSRPSRIAKMDRFDLETVDILKDAPNVINVPIANEFLASIELAVHSDTRKLSPTTLRILIAKKETFFANLKSQNEQQILLNHICEQVFCALAFYIHTHDGPNPFEKVAFQFLWDLSKYFSDNVTSVTQARSIHSFGTLLPLIEKHYKRLEHLFHHTTTCSETHCCHMQILQF